MATKKSGSTATRRGRSRKTADPVPPAPASGPTARGLNDVRGDNDPVLGHSVVVTAGEHEGTFGTFEELTADNQAVVTPRSAPLSRVTVPLDDIRPADSHRR